MAKRNNVGKARARKGRVRAPSSASENVVLLIEQVANVLPRLNEYSRDGSILPGVYSINLRIAAGDASVELTIRGGAAPGHPETVVFPTEEAEALGGTAAFELLPQVSGNGYYSYSAAASQFGTLETIATVLDVGKQWQTNKLPVFGVGDISLEKGGPMPGHTSGHQIGRNVDVRPMRTDSQQKPVTWKDAAYSRERTQLLVDNFRAHANTRKIFFNDPQITGVTSLKGHDNHLHIEMGS